MPTLEKNYLRYGRTNFSIHVNTLVLLYLISSNFYENCVSGKDKVGIYIGLYVVQGAAVKYP